MDLLLEELDGSGWDNGIRVAAGGPAGKGEGYFGTAAEGVSSKTCRKSWKFVLR